MADHVDLVNGGPGGAWRLEVGFLSDRGRVRERNEDAYAVFLPYAGEENRAPVDALFAVADGMGGHDAGDRASRFVADAVEATFAAWSEGPVREIPDIPTWIERLMQEIHGELRSLAVEGGRPRGMGSTLTLAVLRDGRLHLGHVGDSRCYRLRDGSLEQLTPDHSWVAEQRRAGMLSAEEEANHPRRNLLTRCLGIGTDLHAFRATEALVDGSRYLLSSDGLHGVLPDAVILDVLRREAAPQHAARRLVELANEAGGEDNVTAIVFDVRRAPALATTEPGASGPSPAEPTGVAPPESDAPGGFRFRLRFLAASGRRALVVGGAVLVLGAVAAGSWLYLGEAGEDGGDPPVPANVRDAESSVAQPAGTRRGSPPVPPDSIASVIDSGPEPGAPQQPR